MSQTTVKGDNKLYFNAYQHSKHHQIMGKVIKDALVKFARHSLRATQFITIKIPNSEPKLLVSRLQV